MTASADNRLNVGEQRHDLLCPAMEEIRGYAYVAPGFIRNCQCALVALVREDERQKAHNVIDHFDMYCGDRDAMHAWIDGTPPNWWAGER